ncbi:hypothetical protein BGZ60DRAFT_118084 [Tricladium varicosporioides]|nr:hypothetical protein BGZ60DRAFT_118084 [Hymenoscyphus varicosporioides]
MDYREKIVNHFEPTDNWVVIDRFFEITQEYEKQPKPFREINAQVSKLFNNDAAILDGFGAFLENAYPKQYAQVISSQRALNEAHRIACETQTDSAILRLPRELRDKIWQEASSANVIHVSRRPAGPAGRSKTWFGRRPRKASKYQFHICRAPNALQTSACPPGIGDHSNCCTDGHADDVPSIKLVCKQIYLELQNDEITFYSKNAFQFADLEVAEDFLFGLSERRRESITHLRLALPYRLKEFTTPLKRYKAWNSIMNYFSNPWDRRSLHMYPQKKESKDLLKLPIYFYYSGCYYENNKHRLHKRWQVGRGNTSWDIGCNEMRLKEDLRLDIAMDMTLEGMPSHFVYKYRTSNIPQPTKLSHLLTRM